MKRYGWIIGLKEESINEYKRVHADVWPGVLQTIKNCNISNYSIFLRKMDDGRHYLFGYFEYSGTDYEADLAKMAADPTTQKWWALCMPMQWPLQTREEGSWWASMEEVFHLD
jgi:L-rhamnose mutarotase